MAFLNCVNVVPPTPLSSSPNSNKGKTNWRQRLLFGDDVIDFLANMNILQVGYGATGCETAKLLCMMNVATSPNSDKVFRALLSILY